MNYKVVLSDEILWCSNDDRFILIKRVNGEIDGLNYCQGDDLEYFLENFNEIDEDLTNFYKAIVPYLTYEGTNEYDGSEEVDRINMAIWAHFEYRNLRDGSKY